MPYRMPCGHYSLLPKSERTGGCYACAELDHLEQINKSIKLKIKPRGFTKGLKARRRRVAEA